MGLACDPDLDAGLQDAAAEALPPVGCGAAGAREVSDARVAEPDQVLRRHAAAAVVVVRDKPGAGGNPVPPASNDGGNPGPGHHRLARLGGDDQALHVHGQQAVHSLSDAVLARARIGQGDLVAVG